MMSRKIDTKRLNKIITILVIIISLVSLAYFAYSFTQESYVSSTFTESIHTCDGESWCHQIWQDYLNDFRQMQMASGLLGIGLPIIFFGGKLLFNYLFPHKSE